MPTPQQLDSLSALLGDPMNADAALLRKRGVDRNPANAAALEALLGIKPSPTGFFSEADLQSAADQKGAAEMAQKIAPIQATTQGNLAVESAKAAGASQLEAQKAQAAKDLADEEAAQGRQTMQSFQQGQGGAPGATPYSMKPSVNAKGQVSYSMEPDKEAQQVQAQQHAAQAGYSQIPNTRAMIDALDAKGMIGPFVSRIESGSAARGLDPLAEMLHLQPKGGASDFNAFKTQLSLTKSNLAYAHGAARAGASPAMQQRFDELLNPNQSPAALRGALATAESWLKMYSGINSEGDFQSLHDQIEQQLAAMGK